LTINYFNYNVVIVVIKYRLGSQGIGSALRVSITIGSAQCIQWTMCPLSFW